MMAPKGTLTKSLTVEDSILPKDQAELELEKLVFGDEEGFRENVRHQAALDSASSEEDESEHSFNRRVLEKDNIGPGSGSDNLEGVEDSDLFFVDTGAPVPDGLTLRAASDAEEFGYDSTEGGEEPAWVDSDDDRVMVSLSSNPRLRKLRVTAAEDVISGREYTKRLRRQFEILYPVPDWALPPKKGRRRKLSQADNRDGDNSASDTDISDEDDEYSAPSLEHLLRSADGLASKQAPISGKRPRLRPEVLDIQRTRDVGGAQPSAIESLAFHPRFPLIISSGPASTIYLHQVSPTSNPPNPLVTSLHIRQTPLSSTAFLSPLGDRVFFSGRRRYFHVWDLPTGKIEKISRIYGFSDEQRTMERIKLSPCGRWIGLVGSDRKGGGAVNILDANTSQWIAQVHVESRGGLADFQWWHDGEGLSAAGKGGEVVEWDMRERKVVARWNDEGAVGTTVIALGGNSGRADLGGSRWVAIGSSSGIVNIYDRRLWRSSSSSSSSGSGSEVPESPKPAKTFTQLTTAIGHVVFSADGQLMAMASRWKGDALRLIHLPSCAVYRNWPTSSTPLGRITAVAFSPASDMLAVANEAGKIRLWEIRA